MYSKMITELSKDIRKLYILEESIIDGDHTESRDLRSRQALLVSEVIQSLQKLKNGLKEDLPIAA
jgi:hypothetical protein